MGYEYKPRDLGMSWRWRLHRFWEAWITLVTLGRK